MMTFCTCNPITVDVGGGVVVGGAATESSSRIIVSGGVVCGGSASVDSSDPWDGMVAVYGLDGTYDGSTDEVIDSTYHALHGTGGGGSSTLTPQPVDGVFCNVAQHFTTGRQFVSCPTDEMIATQAFSVSGWVYIESFYQSRNWFTRGFSTTSGDKWIFTLGHSVLNHVWAKVKGSNNTVYDCYSSATLSADRWYHIACTWTPATGIAVFINGAQSNSTSVTEDTLADYTNGNYIARYETGGYPLGKMQEFRLHPVAREADWLAAEFANFCTAFYSVGSVVDSPTTV